MNYRVALLVIVALGVLVLGWSPHADRTTWFLENVPIFILVPLIIGLRHRISFTYLTLTVLAIHAFVLMFGGHYTYAEVPLGFWVRDAFDLGRNHYDRLGHFMQGFGPAFALRELLLKKSPLRKGKLLTIVVVSMCLAFSAFYEMIEWWSALILGQGADAFLGTQGDPWDTQWDMFLALVGSTIAATVFAPLQDSALEKHQSHPRG